MIKYVEDVTPEMVDYFILNIRDMDNKEVFEATGCYIDGLRDFLIDNVANTQALIDTDDGELLAIGGTEGVGCVCFAWMLFTRHIENRKIKFLRYSKTFIEKIKLKEKYTIISNRVYAKNTLHIAWLEWMGAEFINKDDDFWLFIIDLERS